MKKSTNITLARDLIDAFIYACLEINNDKEKAIKAIRLICREFGGQQLYIPKGVQKSIYLDIFESIVSEVYPDNARAMAVAISRSSGGLLFISLLKSVFLKMKLQKKFMKNMIVKQLPCENFARNIT
ncbi:MAG: hypothetical protein ACRC4W_00590 [Treponemataceae bacterium]